MERNTITTAGQLKIGDRFYRVNDKKKIVWEKVPSDIKITHFQTYKHFASTPGMKFPQAINKDTKVVFLRHKDKDFKYDS